MSVMKRFVFFNCCAWVVMCVLQAGVLQAADGDVIITRLIGASANDLEAAPA